MNFQANDVQACQSEMQKICSDITNTLKDIKNDVNTIQSKDYWVGDASDYYVNSFKAVTKQFDTVSTEINNSVKFLQSVIDDYINIDNQILKHANSFLGK